MLLVRSGTVVNPGGSLAAEVLLDGDTIAAVAPGLGRRGEGPELTGRGTRGRVVRLP
jgi:hypothetical protein